jgi:c-di-GMP-binding flagellar brake protein YcgR
MADDDTSREPKLTPLPESRDPELEQFRIRAPAEVGRVFRDMAKAGELITAYTTSKEFFLTRILGVDTEHRLFLDYGTDERVNQRALESPQMLFVGRHYQVRVQFNTRPLNRVTLKDGPAFAVPFPDSLLRIQRREFYRLTTPIASRPICRITLPEGAHLAAAIVDISLGGIGIIETDKEHEGLWQPGTVIPGVVVQLSDEIRIQSDIEIRNLYPVTLANGQQQLHVGCKFLQLEPRMNADIQRYIHRVDLERRRLTRE